MNAPTLYVLRQRAVLHNTAAVIVEDVPGEPTEIEVIDWLLAQYPPGTRDELVRKVVLAAMTASYTDGFNDGLLAPAGRSDGQLATVGR